MPSALAMNEPIVGSVFLVNQNDVEVKKLCGWASWELSVVFLSTTSWISPVHLSRAYLNLSPCSYP